MKAALFGLAALALSSQSLSAQSNDASVYVVHGIVGSDLGLDPELPVDVQVNGTCAIPDFRFGNVVGPLSLPAGMYDIEISLADPNNPCGGTVVIQASVPFAANETATVIAHLDDVGNPTASKFVNDVSPVANPDDTRVILHHTAAAPAVDLYLRRFNGGGSGAFFGVTNGLQGAADVREGQYLLAVAVSGTSTRALRGVFNWDREVAYAVFVVGSASTGSLQPIGFEISL